MFLKAVTQRSDATLASCETRTKLRKPCGKSARNSSCTGRWMCRSRRANVTESSSIGSRWHAWHSQHQQLHSHQLVIDLATCLFSSWHSNAIITGRLPWWPDGIKFTQCVSGQKISIFAPAGKLCVGLKNDSNLLELSQRSLSACKVWRRLNYACRL